ncbi:MAG: MBL fold metallo-hydrolase [Planctomycetota bacterium]|nr:MBL fold metallo-hydrolase [Planctomycetota bacterium]
MPLSEASVILLGTGTSSGVPVLGCDCSVCTSTDPRDQRLRTSAALRFQDPDGHFREMLIDCGPDLRHQALRAGLRRCDGIFVTHHHVDHIYGLDEVRRFNALMKEPIDLFAEERTLDAIHRVYRHIFDAAKNLNPSFVAHVRTHRVTTDGSVSRMGIRATPIRLLHGKMPILGWRFDAVDASGAALNDVPGPFPFAWCTDCSAIPPESWPRLEGLRHLFLDMLRPRSHPTHFCLDESLAVAEKVAAKQTWFIHMSHDVAHADLEASLPSGIAPAYDGLVVSG